MNQAAQQALAQHLTQMTAVQPQSDARSSNQAPSTPFSGQQMPHSGQYMSHYGQYMSHYGQYMSHYGQQTPFSVQQTPLTEQCKQSLATWDRQGTFNPHPETFRWWLRTSSYGVYVVAGSMFVVASAVLIGLLGLLRPSFATRGDDEKRLSWGKIILYALLIAALITGAAALAQWLDTSTNNLAA